MANRTIKQEIFSLRDDALSTLAAAFPEAVKDGEVDWKALEAIFKDTPSTGAEKYELTWAGKAEAKREAGRDAVGRTLRFCPEESKDAETTQNLYIEGDNLEVLKLLRENYYGAVKMIYIDPPYNTGNDFVYRDNFTQSEMESELAEGNIDEEGQRLRKNPKSTNRYHANWLSMLYPRLRIARDLLSQDGLIAISIDDNEITNLKKCCDEVFGEGNFISQITILSNPRGRQSETFVASVHEYLLLYSRNISECRIFGEELSEEQVSEYSLVNSAGEKYRLLGLRQRGVAWRREDRPAMYFPIYVNPNNGKCSFTQTDVFTIRVLPLKPDGQEGRWKWGTARVQKDIDLLEGRIVLGRNEWDISVKDYLNKSDGELRTRKIKTLWDEKELNYQNGTEEIKGLFDGKTVFPYAKPLSLLQRIISFATDEDSIVLDFFSGSSGMAHAVMAANAEDGGSRKFIMIQWPESVQDNPEYNTIADIGRERIRSAGCLLQKNQSDSGKNLFDKIDHKCDVGFLAFRAADTVIRWTHDALRSGEQMTLDEAAMSDKDRLDFMPGFTDIDVVYEIALRQNDIPLSSPVRPVPKAGKRTYIFADSILVCLEESITPELINTLADIQPTPNKFVLRDSAFEDDIALKDETLRRLQALVARNTKDAKPTYVVDFI